MPRLILYTVNLRDATSKVKIRRASEDMWNSFIIECSIAPRDVCKIA